MPKVEDDELHPQAEQPVKVLKIEDYEFHLQAQQRVRQFVSDYTILLIKQAKILAFIQRTNQVQSVHVEHARDLIAESQKRTWIKELVLIFGGALIGVCVYRFLAELSAGHKALTATYAVFGLVGLILAFFGIRR